MPSDDLADLDIPLERDGFVRAMIGELAATLQDVVGVDDASGFISVVGQSVGEQIDGLYRTALGTDRFSREQVATVLVDLKRRIQGDFYVIEQDDERIVLGNRACPFAEHVQDRPALCMMTSNVFGRIAGEHLGFAKVELRETIAEGARQCRVVVHLQPGPDVDLVDGRTYYRSSTS